MQWWKRRRRRANTGRDLTATAGSIRERQQLGDKAYGSPSAQCPDPCGWWRHGLGTQPKAQASRGGFSPRSNRHRAVSIRHRHRDQHVTSGHRPRPFRSENNSMCSGGDGGGQQQQSAPAPAAAAPMAAAPLSAPPAPTPAGGNDPSSAGYRGFSEPTSVRTARKRPTGSGTDVSVAGGSGIQM